MNHDSFNVDTNVQLSELYSSLKINDLCDSVAEKKNSCYKTQGMLQLDLVPRVSYLLVIPLSLR